MATAKLFIDYQNVHFTAWECFAPYGSQVYDSLIHPVKFADQVILARRAKGMPEVDLTEIHVFRGLPVDAMSLASTPECRGRHRTGPAIDGFPCI